MSFLDSWLCPPRTRCNLAAPFMCSQLTPIGDPLHTDKKHEARDECDCQSGGRIRDRIHACDAAQQNRCEQENNSENEIRFHENALVQMRRRYEGRYRTLRRLNSI